MPKACEIAAPDAGFGDANNVLVVAGGLNLNVCVLVRPCHRQAGSKGQQ